ncbi:MAG: hypothetical protein QM484_03050 [Woeseiaceae bacterium]
MKKFNTIVSLFALVSFLIMQPAQAAKFKCWTNNEGVKECGSYVPPEYSQKRIETRGNNGRVIEVKERAKNLAEIAEIERQVELKKIEDAKIAEQNKKDSILLNTFTLERDINMLRDSKLRVIDGLIKVTIGNNKALDKKLKKLQKKAANIERHSKKPTKVILDDITIIENRIKKNLALMKTKHLEQEVIKGRFKKDLQRFKALKVKKK